MPRGFTLLEMLIVIGFAALLFGMVGLFQTGPRFHALELERGRELIRTELVRARTDALSGNLDRAWGVAFTPSSITRFAGSSFATRDGQFDVTATLSAPVTISGASEIVFTRPRGEPAATGSVLITDGTRSYTIQINSAGTITIQ